MLRNVLKSLDSVDQIVLRLWAVLLHQNIHRLDDLFPANKLRRLVSGEEVARQFPRLARQALRPDVVINSLRDTQVPLEDVFLLIPSGSPALPWVVRMLK